jgi:hypothetical protein
MCSALPPFLETYVRHSCCRSLSENSWCRSLVHVYTLQYWNIQHRNTLKWDLAKRCLHAEARRSQVWAPAVAENQLFILICCWLQEVAIHERSLWLPVCCVSRVKKALLSAVRAAQKSWVGAYKSPNLFLILNFTLTLLNYWAHIAHQTINNTTAIKSFPSSHREPETDWLHETDDHYQQATVRTNWTVHMICMFGIATCFLCSDNTYKWRNKSD